MRPRLTIITIGILLSALVPAVNAAVQWQSNSLRESYNPSGNFYTYAPSIIVDGTTEHIWTCHNDQDNVVQDHIYYTKIVNGVVQSSQSVLQKSASGWDSFHVCDPSVLRQNITFNSVSYSYVMFYLANDQACSCNNQIGVAVAQSINGPWTKIGSPIVSFPANTPSSYWGVGQPSATSIDGNGRMLLFYREEGINGYKQIVREVNLSNANSPVLGSAIQMPLGGEELTGETNTYVNFDLAYDSSRDRFFMVTEQVAFPTAYPTYIDEAFHVFSIAGSAMLSGSGTWKLEGSISQSLTGFPRNHNAGLKRNEYGGLADSGKVSVVFTRGTTTSPTEWSYDLWEVSGNIVSSPLGNNTTYALFNDYSDKAASVDGNNAANNGAKIIQWDWVSSNLQRWVAEDLGDDVYRFKNVQTGKYLSLDGTNPNANGNQPHQWDWANSDMQRWNVSFDGVTIKLRSKYSGKFLSIDGNSPFTNGSSVLQWEWLNSDMQRWLLAPQ